jgi:hypothetical protein
MLVEIDDGHVRALSGVKDGDGTSDAGIAARDQSHFAPELIAPAIVVVLRTGPRRHLRFDPRLMILSLRRLDPLLLFLIRRHLFPHHLCAGGASDSPVEQSN